MSGLPALTDLLAELVGDWYARAFSDHQGEALLGVVESCEAKPLFTSRRLNIWFFPLLYRTGPLKGGLVGIASVFCILGPPNHIGYLGTTCNGVVRKRFCFSTGVETRAMLFRRTPVNSKGLKSCERSGV